MILLIGERAFHFNYYSALSDGLPCSFRAVNPSDVTPQVIRTITEENKDEDMSPTVMDEDGAATIKNVVEEALQKHGVLTLESLAKTLVPYKTERGTCNAGGGSSSTDAAWCCCRRSASCV